MTWKDTYQSWLSFDQLDADLKADLDQLEDDSDQLEDAFYKSLEFGTAGMRGLMGPGTNRMNIYTVRQASQGLSDYLLDRFDDAKQRGVAIGYDSRHQSQAFAFEAAKTLGQSGIKSYVFDSICPTPELSFAVRHFKCRAGIMVTASHNPPAYNGYKVYGDDGGQLLPQAADQLTAFVNQVQDPLSVQVAQKDKLIQAGLLNIVGPRVDKSYLEMMRSVTLNPDMVEDYANDLTIVYTPLHGTGQKLVKKALYNAGFQNVYDVDSQKGPDPDFSTVESPNPETEGAFAEAIKVGTKQDADVLIASDPDADRLGVAVKTVKGSYRVLSGNEIGSLLTHYILKAQFHNKLLPKYPVVIKSIVSSDLPDRIADSFGARVETVLTGFKYIADRIKFHNESDETSFMFGFEESNGYLSRSFVRDKDAVQASVLVAEMALYYKLQDFSLVDALFDLYNHYGHFKDTVFSLSLEGKKGQDKIDQIMEKFRQIPLKDFAGFKVKAKEDYLSSQRSLAEGGTEDIDLPQSNVLKFQMTDGSWLAVRPSGTEPKIKCYLSATDGSKLEVDRKLERLEQAARQLMD